MNPQFILYRIIGNYLPPRHSRRVSEQAIRFIVESEPRFPNCEKRFLLNRIVDQDYASLVAAIIESGGYSVETVPFVSKTYEGQGTFEDRVRYLTNLNPARNLVVKNGLRDAPIVLPFDSGCCFDELGWEAFVRVVTREPEAGYYAVHMQRIDRMNDFAQSTPPPCTELNQSLAERLTEPQIAITRRSDQFFNEDLKYGNMPKAELLIRLGVKGPWQHFSLEIRDQALKHRSKFFGSIPSAGYVYRLPCTDDPAVEAHGWSRATARVKGMAVLVRELEQGSPSRGLS